MCNTKNLQNVIICGEYRSKPHANFITLTMTLTSKIDEYRRNWFSHLQRMPQNRITLKSYHYKPQGKTKETLERAAVNLETEQIKGWVQSLMFMMMMMMTPLHQALT